MNYQLPQRLRRKFSPGLKQDIFFLHVPKCGGTSLVNSIAKCYKPLSLNKRHGIAHLDSHAALLAANLHGYDPLVYNREILAYYLAGNFHYVYGHFAFSEKAHDVFKTKYAFITLIREPVSKWFSLYFYNRYKNSDDYALNLDLEEFLETEQAASYGCDYVMQFAGDDTITSYTSPAAIPQFSSRQSIDRAIANLEKFDLVGTLEQLDEFKREFKVIYGLDLVMKHRRKSPVSKELQKQMITPEILEKVKYLNRPNTQIYEYVVSKLVGSYAVSPG